MRNHRLIQTEDGSPSLETTYESGVTERMHHFRGAMSESLYIYGPAIEAALSFTQQPRLMSLGLGLGYNELIACAFALKAKQQIELVTFELDQGLCLPFRSWLAGDNSEYAVAYEQILRLTAEHFSLNPAELKNFLRHLNWDLRGSFPESLTVDEKFHAILYDAFSRKMDEPLWSEVFLNHFLLRHSADRCAFATYAATGSLKRALKSNGFRIVNKSGFGGKKESTFALRE